MYSKRRRNCKNSYKILKNKCRKRKVKEFQEKVCTKKFAHTNFFFFLKRTLIRLGLNGSCLDEYLSALVWNQKLTG